ncbi:MAG: hypothetical protein AAGK97_11615, partial [Bacteroidota bacterium]
MRIIYIILILLTLNKVHTQGNFTPPEADLTFPRTILAIDQIEMLKNRLTEFDRKLQYESIVRNAFLEIETDNVSNGGRIKRAAQAREIAFVLLFNLKLEDNNYLPLDNTDRQILISKCFELLNSINDSIQVLSGWTFYNDWQNRTKEIIHYLIAYDLMMAVPDHNLDLEAIREKLQAYVGNLYMLATDTYPRPIPGPDLEFFSFNLNNHGVMMSGALGLAAIVLAEAESPDPNFQPQSWINAAMWNLDNTLWRADGLLKRVSEPDVLAGYAEGPNYFAYGFENAFPFIKAMWNFLPDENREYSFYEYNLVTGGRQTIARTIRNPWYDESYERLYDWANIIRMPGGGSPAIHDSYLNLNIQGVGLVGREENYIKSDFQTFGTLMNRTQFLASDITGNNYDLPLFQALPEAGSLIFRNTYDDPKGTYMHVIAKNGVALEGAKAHHQADVGSFQLYYNQSDMIYDSGYPGADQRANI